MQPVTASSTPSVVMVASNHKKLICTYISCRGVLVWGWNKFYCFKRYCSKLSFGRVPQNFESLLVELQDVAVTFCPRQSWLPMPFWVINFWGYHRLPLLLEKCCSPRRPAGWFWCKANCIGEMRGNVCGSQVLLKTLRILRGPGALEISFSFAAQADL